MKSATLLKQRRRHNYNNIGVVFLQSTNKPLILKTDRYGDNTQHV